MNSTMELDYVVEKAEFILNERHDKKLQEVVNEAKELFRKYKPTVKSYPFADTSSNESNG